MNALKILILWCFVTLAVSQTIANSFIPSPGVSTATVVDDGNSRVVSFDSRILGNPAVVVRRRRPVTVITPQQQARARLGPQILSLPNPLATSTVN